MLYEVKTASGAIRMAKTNFGVGDYITPTNDKTYQRFRKDEEFEVIAITFDSTYDQEMYNGSYQTVYKQKVYLKGHDERPYLGTNFQLVRRKGQPNMSTNHALENHKPTLAIELETNKDGDDVEIGEFSKYETLSQAQGAVSRMITDSIRKDNIYRRFRIYQMISVAGAREPEIEFK